MLRVLAINHSDAVGGAARAACRIHKAMRLADVDSRMLVNIAAGGDWTIEAATGKLDKLAVRLRPHVVDAVKLVFRTDNPILHSPAILPSAWPQKLNRSDVDVVHLHWVNHEMMSIEDIGRIRKPMVWTLHDMWAFCGAEHVTSDGRWRDGYNKTNRPPGEHGVDLNRWTWGRKRKSWKQPMHIVTPSNWLASCVRDSALMGDWPVRVIPNPIDTEEWKPVDRSFSRRVLGLPEDAFLLLFGAVGGTAARHKGFDLLRDALKILSGEISGLELVIFGESAPRAKADLGFPIHYVGHLYDDLSLRILYSAADVLVIPSRIDNLPNTGVESLACGTPIVAFNTCGLPDIVDHRGTGYLARPFDVVDLAEGIRWMAACPDMDKMRKAARNKAIEKFSCPVVSSQYLEAYQEAIRSGL